MSTHENLSEHGEALGGSNRSFGFVFTVVFLVLGLFPMLDGGAVVLELVAIAGLFLAVALVFPKALGPLNRLWTKFGLLLGAIVNPVVLGIVFYGVLTPIAIAIRLGGKDPLRLKPTPDARTYWIDRTPPGPAPESMKQQF
jgi:hypothetical protein